jgi:hypothetical protein
MTAALACLLIARPAHAQHPVVVGASYAPYYSELGESTATGGHVDVAAPLAGVTVVGEAGFNHFEGALVSTWQGGIRHQIMAGRTVHPFVQVVGGLWRCCALNELVVQPGGGLEIGGAATRLRVQFDYRRIFMRERGENGYRLSAGVVIGGSR